MPIFRNPFPAFALLFILLQLSIKVHPAEVPISVASTITIHTVNNPNSFIVEIPQTDYDHTYDGSVTAQEIYPSPGCGFLPATFGPKLSGSYEVPGTWTTAGANFHMDSFTTYRFISTTATSSVQGLGYGEIKSNPVGALTGGVQMVIDQTPPGIMYVFNLNGGFTYDLANYITNVNLATPVVPDMTPLQPFSFATLPPAAFEDSRFDGITNRIYVRAGNEIGYITLPFTAATYIPIFQEVTGHGTLKDFAIRGDYVYALQEEALFVRKIGTLAQQEQFNIRRGRFIEVTTNSIIIVGDTTSIIYEYFIVDVTTPPIPTIEQEITFNRHIPIQHGNIEVLDVDSDDHYLYIATKKQTLIVRHSIPKEHSHTNFYQEAQPQWGGDDVRFLESTTTGENKFMAFRGTIAYEYTMGIRNPELWCTANKLAGCKFTLTIEGYQRRCPSPTLLADPHDVCKLTQTLVINVLESSTACPDSTKNAEGLAVTPGLIYHGSGFVSENGDVKEREGTPYVRKARPTNFTVQPHYNQTRNEERAKNYTGRHNNIFNQATPVDQSSTRIPLPHTGGDAPTPTKKEQQPVANTETITSENNSEKNGEIKEKINENKELMNGLVISVIGLFAILGLFIMFVIWHFAHKQKNGVEKKKRGHEDDKSGFVVIPDSQKKSKISLNGSQLYTFVDESKTHGDTEISRIEF